MVAVGQCGGRGVTPVAVRTGDRAAKQQRSVIDLDRHIGRRRTGERQDVGIGDAVGGVCRVRRDRADDRHLHNRWRGRWLHRSDRYGRVAELQIFDVLERIGAVRAAGAQIDDPPAAVGILRDLIRTRGAGIDGRVGAAHAIKCVVPCPTGKLVVGRIAGDDVVARAADRVLDQGSRVVVVEVGIGDVANRSIAIAEVGKLRRRRGRPAPGLQVDVHTGRIIGKVVGVVAATVPQRHEDGVAAGCSLGDTVDGLLPCAWVPLVDCIAAVRVVVRAVHVLKRRDIVEHQRRWETPGRVGQTLRGRSTDIGAIAHHRVFERVHARRNRTERTGSILRMLQAQQMPGLMDDGQPAVVAYDGVRVPAIDAVEPGIAAFWRNRWIVAPRRAGHARSGVAQCCALRRRLGDLREGDVGHRRIHIEDRGGRRLLYGIERREALVLFAGAVGRAAETHVERTAGWKAVGKAVRSPLHTAVDIVDVGYSGRGDCGYRRQASLLGTKKCAFRRTLIPVARKVPVRSDDRLLFDI